MGVAETGTVSKALSILDVIAEHPGPLRFADLQRLSGLPKATLHRLLQTLVMHGMLTQHPESGSYGMGLHLLRLAHAAWRSSSLGPRARPLLEALARDTGLTAHLAQLDMGHVLYIDRRDAQSADASFSEAGKVAPAYCTAVGKAMLAFLPPDQRDRVLAMQSFQRFTPSTLASEPILRQSLDRVRARGHALDREEYQIGVTCIAVPLLTAGGRLIGALSLTAAPGEAGADLEHWLPRLGAAAAEMSRLAEDWAFPAEPANEP